MGGERAGGVFAGAGRGALVGDGEFALRVVVLVEPGSPRKQEGTLHVTAGAGAKFESGAGKKRLRSGVLRGLHSPGAQVFGEDSHTQSASELALKSDVAGGAE